MDRDNDRRGKEEEQLRFLGLALAPVSDGVIVVNSQGEPVFISKAGEHFSPVTPELMRPLAQPVLARDLRSPHGRSSPLAEPPLARALRGETVTDFLAVRDLPEGEAIFSTSASPVRDQSGQIIGAYALLHDVTEHWRAAEALRWSREDLKHALALAHTGSWRLDVKRNALLWSDETHRIFGVPLGTPLNYEAFLDYVHPDDRTTVYQAWQAALQGVPYDVEHRIIVGDEVRWVHERAELELNAQGALEGGFGAVQDVTDFRRAAAEREQLLAEAQRRTAELEATFSSVAEGLSIFDPEGNTVMMNEPVRRILGYGPAHCLLPVWDRVALQDARSVDGAPISVADLPVARALRGETVGACELAFRRLTDGEIVLVSASAAPIRTADGKLLGAVVTHTDITARKQAEADREQLLAEVQRQAMQLRALLNNLREGVAIIDGEGRIVLRNQSMRDITGIPDEAANVTGYPLRMLRLDGSELPYEEWPRVQLLKDGKPFTGFEFIQERRDGTRRRLVSSGSAVCDERGSVALAIVVSRDVSELRRLEVVREDFVRAVSHDLRQPLTVIQGQAQLLKGRLERLGLPARDVVGAERIVCSAQRMGNMISDLLAASSLEVGQQALDRTPLDLYSLTQNAIREINFPGHEERVVLKKPGRALPVVLADATAIERVLGNLIGNALKFSPSPSPVVVRFASRKAELVVSVSDLGPGIPAEDLPHLFERYFRSQMVRERHNGLGLGLYISRLVVEAHGGRIWVESAPDRGSTFSFTLPHVTKGRPSPPSPSRPHAAAPPRAPFSSR